MRNFYIILIIFYIALGILIPLLLILMRKYSKFKFMREYLIVFFSSYFLTFLIMPLRGGYVIIGSISGSQLSSIAGFILNVLLTFSFLKRKTGKRPVYIVLCALLGASIVDLPLHIIEFKDTLCTLLEFIIRILGVISGYLLYKLTSVKSRIFCGILLLSACFWASIKGNDMWGHKLVFGTFTGKIENTGEYNFIFQTDSGDTLSLSDFKGKYLLLDCWYTYCGYCYQDMSEVQKLYDKYKENPTIKIYAMHSAIQEKQRDNLPENYATGSEILQKKGFDYPCLSININDPVLEELGVNGYPTVLIFDKESKLIFRGNIENAGNYIDKLLKK